jgi:YHS domain-containing protein
MFRAATRVFLGLAFVGVVTLPMARALMADGLRIPPAYAPLENLVAPWKGRASPAADPVRGWPETHRWAWTFEGGSPAGMSVELEGNKTLAKGRLIAESAGKFVLDGTDPEGKPARFKGVLGPDKRSLILDREGDGPDGSKERLTLRMPSNGIRYTLWLDRKAAGAPQYKRVIDVGLTKEGEAFAAAGSTGELPKCIVTGGAATMTISYQGKTFPICCTGCRDEFTESPEKYLAKVAAAAKGGSKPTSKGASRGSDDGFEGLVEAPAARSEVMPDEPRSKSAPKPRADTEAVPKPKGADRAATWLTSAQNLEKSGKAAAALVYYKRIVAEAPRSPQAATAASRIKAIEAR